MPNPEDNKLPDPQAGGRYERNTDGTIKTLHQTDERDIAAYAREKAARQAGDAPAEEAKSQPEAGSAPNTNAQE